MSTGLTGHRTIFKSLAQIRKEVCGNDVDILSLACTLNCCDSALKRVTAAACRNQCIQSRICGYQSLCCLGTTLRRSTCVLRLRQFCLIIRMLCVPFLNASFVAFPSAKPGSVALLPADQTDVSVALVQKNLN